MDEERSITMKWSERDYQEYRKEVCCLDISATCEDCTKTGEDIKECYWELYFNAQSDEE